MVQPVASAGATLQAIWLTGQFHGVLRYSDATAEHVVNPLFIDTANALLSSHYTYWEGQKQLSVVGKPQIASIVGFRVEPGGKQQALHRDDADYHTRNCDFPVMLGCVTALTKTTKENGATIVIPKSHKWGPDRCPYDHEAIPAELDVGDAAHRDLAADLFRGRIDHVERFGRDRIDPGPVDIELGIVAHVVLLPCLGCSRSALMWDAAGLLQTTILMIGDHVGSPHHITSLSTPSRASAIRRRVPGLMSSGRASGANQPTAWISPWAQASQGSKASMR
ncbi:MAG: hypothetical protein B7X77_08490 [Caulobacter sp. 39-67-4]|nr:MAG: hypothetical protein B7X77_08490 [Caulobacter sp. 39-67-4]